MKHSRCPPSSPERGRRAPGAARLAFAAGLLAASLVVGPALAAPVHLSPDQARALGVRTEALRVAAGRPVASAPGVFVPRPQAREVVSAPFAGTVARVMVVEGQAVKAGQPLAVLLSREAAAAAAERSQAAADLRVAEAEAARAARLAQEGIVAGSRAEQAQARLQAARALAASRSAATAGASASGQLVLRAPFGGRVASVEAHAGEGLQALAPAFTVDRDGPIQVQANLPSAYAGKVRVGDPARVEGAPAKVVGLGSVIDPRTRGLSLRVETQARPGFIPGRATTVEVLAPGAGLLEAPRSAVARMGGRSVVFVADGERFVPTPVEVTAVSGDVAVLSGALKAGARVASAGVPELQSQAEN